VFQILLNYPEGTSILKVRTVAAAQVALVGFFLGYPSNVWVPLMSRSSCKMPAMLARSVSLSVLMPAATLVSLSLSRIWQSSKVRGANRVVVVINTPGCFCLGCHSAQCSTSLPGPALLSYNSAIFTEDDFKSIQRIGDSWKRDTSRGAKTGRFGIGFNAGTLVWCWAGRSSVALPHVPPSDRLTPVVSCHSVPPDGCPNIHQ